jgi:hypothetical protein
MLTVRKLSLPRGFSLIEAALMIVALVIFSMVLYAVIKKDYLKLPPAPSKAAAPVAGEAPTPALRDHP